MLLLISNADTELLAMRSVVEDLPAGAAVRWVHPDRIEEAPRLDGVIAVVVRLLGGADAWDGLAELCSRCRSAGVALIAAGGEAAPDPALLALSTVPTGVATEVHRYLAAGGPANMANLVRFVTDTVTMSGHGFEPPSPVDDVGVWDGAGIGPGGSRRDGRPLVAVIFYRAHLVAGNTTYVADLCEALAEAGADAVALWTYSLRPDAGGRVAVLELCCELGADVVVTSIRAGGSAVADGSGWEVPALDELGIPVIQAPASSRSRREWADDDAGLSPLDVASGVAIPEFDGRIVGPTYTFKETVEGGAVEDWAAGAEIIATRADPERCRQVSALAVRTARLRATPVAERRVAIVLSAYPTKRSRLGNAVGLDTPASAIGLLEAMSDSGYRLDGIPADGDALMERLAAGFTYDCPDLDSLQVAMAAGSLPVDSYTRWFRTLPGDAAGQVRDLWGGEPGRVYTRGGAFHFPGVDLGNVMVAIQPPRGFGADPIATYHAPDVAPPHHYLAFYRWLAASTADGGWGADAIVHLGKHGTVEWLPGKALALSAGCFPDAAVADVPFFYPFVVNDPGEGAQAKRRTHAVVVDHLPPPLTRADSYDDIARLEQLLDALAAADAMDPAKAPALRDQLWDLLVDAEIHRDLDLGDAPPAAAEEFDEMVLHVDGYLCAIKDAQIRGGLHVLGRVPAEDALVDLVLAVTRLPQGPVPALRAGVAAELGVDLASAGRVEIDRVEAACREQVEALAASGWAEEATTDPTLRWVARRLIPDLAATPGEIANLLGGLAGRHVPAGPSGAPSRGAANVLPTGRNFYSVDPKSIPSPLAWEVGRSLADRLVERHLSETGSERTTGGLARGGTSCIRTGVDDGDGSLALPGV
ncbi:MAG: cobaltochelatase subunit CobN, partial [bacterium]|nr:cobaltochelatase subunit CobN [bacterium]